MESWRKDLFLPAVTVDNAGEKGMKVTFKYYLPSKNDQEEHGKVEAENVEAVFYRDTEQPVKLTGEFTNNIPAGSGPPPDERNRSCRHVFMVPWGPNSMDDAWVVLRLNGRNFWIEIPYGFSRNPDEALEPADPHRSGPVFPVPVARLTREDLVIPWEFVTYRIDDWPKKGAGVWINLSNPDDASAELSLSRFDGDVREPRAALTIINGKWQNNPGRCVSLTLITSDPIRTQMFKFSRSGTDDRRWGSVHLSIGKVTRTFTVPSSLFNYVHGHVRFPKNVSQLRIAEKWWSQF